MNLPNLKRRTAAIFYPLQVPIRYKMENQITGQGRTIELNGELVRFESDRPLPANRTIQLVLPWPASLPDGTPLNLWITGSTTGSIFREIEVGVGSHEFRTRRGAALSMTAGIQPVTAAEIRRV